MDKNDLSGIRVLLVGMRGHGAQILRTVMTAAGISRKVARMRPIGVIKG